MEQQENNAYILGTEWEELHRLGLQHQVWSSEARTGWDNGNFAIDQTILDLGCGPGFCTTELAYIVGAKGKVIAVDQSEGYIKYLENLKSHHNLSIELMHADFDQMQLSPSSLDGAYCRWALAWIPNPKEIIAKVINALKPGGRFVIQEYYDWSTLQTAPPLEGLKKGIAAALKSFKKSDSEIDIGKDIPSYCKELGIEIISQRSMSKLVTPDQAAWDWPATFFHIYFPKVAEMGYLTQDELYIALKEIDELRNIPGSNILTPLMVELVLERKV